MRRWALFFSFLLYFPWLILFTGCGYTFQQTQNPLLDKYHVRRVYVAPLKNESFKPGVENLVYNELVRTIAANRRVLLVQRLEDADAVLQGTVNQAGYGRSSVTAASQLIGNLSVPPAKASELGGISVARDYLGMLTCTFSLVLQRPPRGVKPELWSSQFSRSKTFPGNNQLGLFGDTSPLVNESEFDRALGDITESMMADVHEAMLAMF